MLRPALRAYYGTFSDRKQSEIEVKVIVLLDFPFFIPFEIRKFRIGLPQWSTIFNSNRGFLKDFVFLNSDVENVSPRLNTGLQRGFR